VQVLWALAVAVSGRAALAEPLPIVFEPAANASSTPRFSQEAAMVHDGGGNLFVTWQDLGGRYLLLSRSEDGAASFGPNTLVVPGADFLSFGQIRIASQAPDDVQMLYTSFNLDTGQAEIVYSRSTDAGATFPNVQLLSFVDAYNSYAGDIAVGWGITTAWTNTNLFSGGNYIGFSVSLDDGQTFSPEMKIDHAPGFVSSPAIALGDDGVVYVAWVEDDDPNDNQDLFEIYLTRSIDYGTSFSVPINVAPNDERSWPPRMAVDGRGRIYVLWTEGEFTIGQKLLLAISNDGGDTFGPPRVLAGPVPELFGNIVAVGQDVVWIAWTESNDPGNFDALRSYLTRSTDGGQTFADAFELPGAAAIASIRREEIYVAWGQAPPGQDLADIFVARGEITSCGDANLDGRVSAADALVVLNVSVGAASCTLCRCDVNGSGAVSAADALILLRAAVGQSVPLVCPPC